MTTPLIVCSKHVECGLESGHGGKCCAVVTCDELDALKGKSLRLDVVSKEVEGMEALLEKEHNYLLLWKYRATSAEDKLDSALAVLRRISEYTEGAASGVGYQCKEWADAFLGGAVERQPPNVCSRCKIHPRTSPLLCDHCIEELGHA